MAEEYDDIEMLRAIFGGGQTDRKKKLETFKRHKFEPLKQKKFEELEQKKPLSLSELSIKLLEPKTKTFKRHKFEPLKPLKFEELEKFLKEKEIKQTFIIKDGKVIELPK